MDVEHESIRSDGVSAWSVGMVEARETRKRLQTLLSAPRVQLPEQEVLAQSDGSKKETL